MALARGDRRWRWGALIGGTLLVLAVCAGLLGLGSEGGDLSWEGALDERDLAMVLHVEDVGPIVGIDELPAATVTTSKKTWRWGLRSRVDHREAAPPLVVSTTIEEHPDRERAERDLLVLELPPPGSKARLPALDWIPTLHLRGVDTLGDVPVTYLVVVNGTFEATWRIENAVIEDPSRLRALLEDEVRAFLAIAR